MHQENLSSGPNPSPPPQPVTANPGRAARLNLLVKWTPFWPSFIENVLDEILRREPPPLRLSSKPSVFWPDVFVSRPFPWKNFAESIVLHVGAAAAIFLFTFFYVRKSGPTVSDVFRHSTITYYKVDDFLPEVATPAPKAQTQAASKGDPELSRQAILSVPKMPDNSAQTIINPPNPQIVKSESPLPNLMISAPTTMPKLTIPVDLPEFQVHRISPLPDTQRAKLAKMPDVPRPDVVPPPAEAAVRKLAGLDLNLPQVEPVDAPKLATPNTAALKRLDVPTQEAVPPPSVAPGADLSQKAMGQLMALNLRPSPPPPEIKVPDGSRNGVFAATPSGRVGAAGTPEVIANTAPAKDAGTSSGGTANNSSGKAEQGAGNTNNNLPPGISISGGSPKPGTTSVVAGPANSVPEKQKTLAAVSPSPFDVRRTTPTPPAEERKLEDKVFGTKKVYAMTMNMPNLTSAGGSWIIRFAEMGSDFKPGELSTPVATSKVDPAYPQDLIRDHVEGVVVLYAVIHADGSVGGVRVLQGFQARLDENARVALSHWRFQPGTKNGVPVDLEAVVHVPFRVRKTSF